MHYAVEDLFAGLACHWGVWVKPPAFWAIFPEVPPCGGKEPRMTCHSSGRIVTVQVYVSWDAEMLPPNPNLDPNLDPNANPNQQFLRYTDIFLLTHQSAIPRCTPYTKHQSRMARSRYAQIKSLCLAPSQQLR